MWQDTISIYKHELYSYTSNEQSKYETKKTILNLSDQIRSDQKLSRVRLFATPWIEARQASLWQPK